MVSGCRRVRHRRSFRRLQLHRPRLREGETSMSDKMQVLFVKQTGHVLAAFTRAADPEDKPKISVLAGSGLLVRNKKVITPSASGGETISVPAGALDVAVVDFDPDVFLLPSIFAAGGGKVESLGATAPSSPTLTAD